MDYMFLVADDDSVVRSICERILDMEFPGSTIKKAVHGEEAISTLDYMVSNGTNPNLVLTDNNMPGSRVTGQDIIKYVVNNYPSIPVIMMSSDRDDVRETALKNGAVEFLKKPFTIDELATAVKNALEYAKK